MELKTLTAQDRQGNIVQTPTVYLYLPGTTTLTDGLEDKDGAALANPFTGSVFGEIQFAAPDGEYDLRIVGGGRDTTIRVRFADASLYPAAVEAKELAVEAAGQSQDSASISQSARDQTLSARDQALAALLASDKFGDPANPTVVPSTVADGSSYLIKVGDYAQAYKNTGGTGVIQAGVLYPLASLIDHAVTALSAGSGQLSALGATYTTAPVSVGVTTPSGSSGTATNAADTGNNTIVWNDADVLTSDGWLTELRLNLRYDGNTAHSLPLVILSGTGTARKVEAYITLNTTGMAAFSSPIFRAGVDFSTLYVKAGWIIGYTTATQGASSPITHIAETGLSMSFSTSFTSPAVGTSFNRSGTKTDRRIQLRSTVVPVIDARVYETRSIQRQSAAAAQVLRERAEKFERKALRKVARKVASGKPAIVLKIGTSLSDNGDSSMAKFEGTLTREFGTPQGSSSCLGSAGGGVTGSYNTWLRQDFGGPKYLRLRGSTASSAFTVYFIGNKFRLWYSKETDGGTFPLTIDGGTPNTIDCNGAQSYRNLFELDLATGGLHSATFSPPGANFAYPEWFEAYETAVPGVIVRNASLGGSSLQHAYTRAGTTTTGNPVAPATVGTNGLDAMFQPDVDAVFIQHHVNDSVPGAWTTTGTGFFDALSSLVDRYVAADIPVILIAELAGHYRMPGDSGYAAYISNKKAIQRQQRKGVWVLDWDAQLSAPEYSDIGHFCRTFYGATYNDANNTFTGDFIHTSADGFRPLDDELSQKTGITVAYDTDRDSELYAAYRHLPAELSGVAEIMSRSVLKQLSPKAAGMRLGAAGRWRAIAYIDPDASNSQASGATAIDNSSVSDEWGKYLANEISTGIVGRVMNIASPGTYWLAFKAKGPITIRLDTSVGKFLHADDSVSPATGMIAPATSSANDEPLWFFVKFQTTAAGNIEIRYARLYDICLVNASGTSAPIVVR